MAHKIAILLLKLIPSQNLIAFILSMIPLIELKGAIPISVSIGNSFDNAFIYSYLGSTLVFFILFFLLIPIFNLLKKIKFINKIVTKIEIVLNKKAEKIANNNNENSEVSKRKFLMKSLFLFVLVPFPVTGVYMGTAISVFLNMKFKDAVFPIVFGNLIAGAIVTILTSIFSGYVNMIIDVLFVIALIMLLIFILKVIKANNKKEEAE